MKKEESSSRLERYRSIRESRFAFSRIAGKPLICGTLGNCVFVNNEVNSAKKRQYRRTLEDESVGSKISKAKSSCSAMVRRIAKTKIHTQLRA